MARQELAIALEPAALLRHFADEPYVFLLDGGDQASWGNGRAVLGCRPQATLRIDANGTARVRRGAVERRLHGDPFALLERFCHECSTTPGSSPSTGVVVAALSYDLRRCVERLPGRHAPAGPLLHAAFYNWKLEYSYAQRRYAFEGDVHPPAVLERAIARLNDSPSRALPAARPRAPVRAVAEMSRSEYETAVSKALDYIAAGDAYQVNFAHRFRAKGAVNAIDLFTAMHEKPAPFAAYVDTGDVALLSNSPECFLTRNGSTLSTFPIKGTRRRGTSAEDDRLLASELERDAKECAEHVMIVDLERNDLGRICRPGSVRVEELGHVHTYPSVHHMVSRVVGELRDGTTLADIFRGTFPGGSITGAPKIRAMQIIDELEPVARGYYTGAVGVIDACGNLAFNIMIRTAVAGPHGITYHAGGGIVADSIPAREYEETLVKAEPFFRALATTGALPERSEQRRSA